MKFRPIVLSGLFAALIFAATAYILHFPVGNGYIHVGDTLIYVAASVLPLPYAAAAAAIGGALADVLTGAPMWAPFTLIIKALLVLPFTSKRATLMCRRNVFALFIAAATTTVGYYAAEAILFGNLIAPLVSVPFSLLQAGASAALFVFIAAAMDRAGLKRRVQL
ncbi:membrane protein [Clostridia bacterium]|nr:membrane protein [Clostridia bacterium]